VRPLKLAPMISLFASPTSIVVRSPCRVAIFPRPSLRKREPSLRFEESEVGQQVQHYWGPA
jgi:hypothetical protein